MKNILDISKHQSTYNAEEAKANGINDVILRAAYGTGKDVKFNEFYAAAKAAGQTVGAYGFATWHYASNNGGSYDTAMALADKQTAAWLEYSKDKEINGYFVIDQELEGGKVMGLTATENELLLNRCIATIKAAGYVPLVYCSASWAMTQFNWENVDADLWLAYYYADPNDPDFDGVPDYKTKTGKYFAFMQSLGDRLAGWQYGRIGYGGKYGVGSANVDRNIFYKAATQKPTHEPLSADPVMVHIGYASQGDLMTIMSKFWKLAIPYVAGDGYITSTVPISSGDQITLVGLCAGLGVPMEIFYGDAKPEADEEEPEPLPEGKPEVEKPVEPEPEVKPSPEPEAPEETPAPETEVPEPKPELDEPEAVGIIDKFLKLLMVWLINYFDNKGA